jgi:AraC family transcriptional regulator
VTRRRRGNHHYQDRVNRVLDFIGSHLDADLSLTRLSAIGGFSRFHFHRIFQSLTGETLNSHVRRVRLERAALLLRTSPRKRITDVALEAGFAGTAEFSRAFKQHFGRTASSWDRRSPLENSKIGKAPEMLPFHTEDDLRRWKAASPARVRVQRLGAFRYVYHRTFEPHGNVRLVEHYHALIAWLAARGTDVRDVVIIGMSLDDPAVTPSERIRHDLGIAFPLERDGILGEILRGRGRATLPLAAKPTLSECEAADLTLRDFAPHEIVSLHCQGDLGDMARAWQYLYRVWLPDHPREPADAPAMEMFVRLPEEIGWTTFDLHTCIPIEEE